MNKNFGITSLVILLLVGLLIGSQIQSCKRGKQNIKINERYNQLLHTYEQYKTDVANAPTVTEIIYDTIVVYKKGQIRYITHYDTIISESETGYSLSNDFLRLKYFDGDYETEDFKIHWSVMNKHNGELYGIDFPEYQLYTKEKVITKTIPAPPIKQSVGVSLGLNVGYHWQGDGLLTSVGVMVDFPKKINLGANLGYNYATIGIYHKLGK